MSSHHNHALSDAELLAIRARTQPLHSTDETVSLTLPLLTVAQATGRNSTAHRLYLAKAEQELKQELKSVFVSLDDITVTLNKDEKFEVCFSNDAAAMAKTFFTEKANRLYETSQAYRHGQPSHHADKLECVRAILTERMNATKLEPFTEGKGRSPNFLEMLSGKSATVATRG